MKNLKFELDSGNTTFYQFARIKYPDLLTELHVQKDYKKIKYIKINLGCYVKNDAGGENQILAGFSFGNWIGSRVFLERMHDLHGCE